MNAMNQKPLKIANFKSQIFREFGCSITNLKFAIFNLK